MSFTLGVNLDRYLAPTATELSLSGAKMARFVLTEHLPSITPLIQNGIEPLAVFARESIPPYLDYTQAMRHYASSYPNLRYVQIGNEPDHVSPSSWTMDPVAYSYLIEGARAAFPQHVRLIGAGLASGQPDYLLRVPNLHLLDAVAVHPYGRRPGLTWPSLTWGFGTVQDLLRQYQTTLAAIPSAPTALWVTEYGTEDATVQAEYTYRMAEALSVLVPVAVHFCWADWMVSPFGLRDVLNTPKGAWDSFRQAAQVFQTPAGTPPGGGTTVPAEPGAQFVLGFAEYARTHPEVGQPLTNEQYFDIAGNISVQQTTGGVLLYFKKSNEITFLPKA